MKTPTRVRLVGRRVADGFCRIGVRPNTTSDAGTDTVRLGSGLRLIGATLRGLLRVQPDTFGREGTISGQRVAYTRVSTLDQNTARQLDGIAVDRTFTDSASGKDTQRPQLVALLGFVWAGDTVVTHSMDRLARNLDDLRCRRRCGTGCLLIIWRISCLSRSMRFLTARTNPHRQKSSKPGAVPSVGRCGTDAVPLRREGIARELVEP